MNTARELMPTTLELLADYRAQAEACAQEAERQARMARQWARRARDLAQEGESSVEIEIGLEEIQPSRTETLGSIVPPAPKPFERKASGFRRRISTPEDIPIQPTVVTALPPSKTVAPKADEPSWPTEAGTLIRFQDPTGVSSHTPFSGAVPTASAPSVQPTPNKWLRVLGFAALAATSFGSAFGLVAWLLFS